MLAPEVTEIDLPYQGEVLNCMILQSHIIINSRVYLTNIPLPSTQGHMAQWLRASLHIGEGPGFKPWSGHFYYVQHFWPFLCLQQSLLPGYTSIHVIISLLNHRLFFCIFSDPPGPLSLDLYLAGIEFLQ